MFRCARTGGREGLQRRKSGVFGLIAALAVCPAVGGQGLDELIERIGAENVPTGNGIVVSLVEAADGSGNYRPDPNHAEFAGKSFTLQSGPSGTSSHANLVGFSFFGANSSIAPSIASIFCYNANGWLTNDFLRANFAATVPPLPKPPGVKIFNNSWVGPDGPTGIDNPILRRADFVVNRDDVLIISGVWTSNPQRVLMSHQYNGLSVGRSNGSHATGDTLASVDGPGRMKPEIVAPASTTSVATAITSAAAALMVETARTRPLDENPLAERAEVIKAVLMGGAKRSPSWTNNPATSGPLRGLTTRPLDEVFGAGEVNVNTAHKMLTGGQFEAKSAPDIGSGICRTGWDIVSVGPGQSRYLRFRLTSASETVTVIATWNRVVSASNMNAWSVANFDLRLWRIDETGQMQTLVGPGGEPYFSAGNVASHSAVDNVELLSVHNLEPGEYIIEVERVNASGALVDVAVSWLMDSAKRYGDLTGDGAVSVFDLLTLLGQWGPCPDGVPGCPGDLNCSGQVGVFDLLELLGDWG